MPKKDSIIPLSGLFPLRDMDGWIPYFLKTGDKNRVDIAILDHYGEWYFRNVPLKRFVLAYLSLVSNSVT